MNYLWYVIYTSARAESKVAERLSLANIQIFYPTLRKLKQWSDRKKLIEEPLFRSYLFVLINEKQYFEVLNTPGVVKYVSFGGKAAIVSQREIDQLKLLIEGASDLEVIDDFMQPGELVELIAGPMMGLKGELVEFRGNSKMAVRVDYLEKSVLFSVPKNYVRKL